MSAWHVRMSNSRGVPYFYNADTKQSLWDAPPELSKEQVQVLPGYAEHFEAAPASKPAKVRASHLLVKHSGSRRPASWQSANITRSKDEAIALLRGYEAEIGGSADKFSALAGKHSDCSSHEHGGDLGWFGPRQMQKPFEDATYALEVGQISDVVDTESGVHLILRTG